METELEEGPEATLRRVLGRLLDVPEERIDDAASQETIAAWDSLRHITLLVELERVYSVRFSTEEALAMRSVADVKQALRRRQVDI